MEEIVYMHVCAHVWVCVCAQGREITGDVEDIWDKEQMGQVTSVTTHSF